MILRKDKSYGLHVAKLAKLPDELLRKAEEILNKYENENANTKTITVTEQISFDLKEDNKLTEEEIAVIKERLKGLKYEV